MNLVVIWCYTAQCLHTQCPNFLWGNRLLSGPYSGVLRLLYHRAPWFLTSALKIFFNDNDDDDGTFFSIAFSPPVTMIKCY